MSRIILVDDHPLVRAGLRLALESGHRHTVVGEAGTLAEAQTLVSAVKPELALVDLTLSGGHGLDLLQWIVAQHPSCHVLVVSMHDEATYAIRALRMGARGYVMKDRTLDELDAAVDRVLTGRIYLSPAMTDRVVGLSRELSAEPDPLESLSPRELQVLEMMGQGAATKDIARALNLSVKTVESHRMRLKQKLNLPETAALIRFAVARSLQRVG